MDQSSSNRQAWTVRRVVLSTLVVAAVLLGFWLTYSLLRVFTLLFMAIVIATALNPVIDRLQRFTRSRTVASVAIHLAALAILIAVVLAMAPLVIQQTTGLLNDLPNDYHSLRVKLIKSDHRLLHLLGQDMPSNPFRDGLSPARVPGEQPAPFAEILSVIGWFTSIFWAIFIGFATLLLSVFWSLEGRRVIRSLLLLIPLERREAGRALIAEIQSKLGAFVRGQATLCVMVAAMALVAYLLIGLPYALALALLVGLLEAMPVLGPMVATIPVVLVGLSMGFSTGLWALTANIFIAQIEGYVLVPRIMDRSVGVHPIVTLLSITALLAILGPIGGVLAIPMAAVLQILLHRFVFSQEPAVQRVPEESRGQVGVLLYRANELLDDLHRQLRAADTDKPEFDRTEEEVERIVVDLASALRRQQQQELNA